MAGESSEGDVVEEMVRRRAVNSLRQQLEDVELELEQGLTEAEATRARDRLTVLVQRQLELQNEQPDCFNLAVLSGSTVIPLDSPTPVSDLLQSGVGTSRAEALHVVKTSELSC